MSTDAIYVYSVVRNCRDELCLPSSVAVRQGCRALRGIYATMHDVGAIIIARMFAGRVPYNVVIALSDCRGELCSPMIAGHLAYHLQCTIDFCRDTIYRVHGRHVWRPYKSCAKTMDAIPYTCKSNPNSKVCPCQILRSRGIIFSIMRYTFL